MPPTTSAPVVSSSARPVTLKDVAARAGVGAMSVSAVLNGGGRGTRYVSDEARQRIEDAARELGYRRNGSAANIRNGRFGAVALLLSTEEIRSYVTSSLLAAIHDELAARDTHLVVTRIPDKDLIDSAFVPKILRELMVDGLIINYIERIPAHLIQMVREQR